MIFTYRRSSWRTYLCATALFLALFTVVTAPASSDPVVTRVGRASATIDFSPDPPAGQTTMTVHLSGVDASKLAATSLRYSTTMPSMSMAGPSGRAVRVPGVTNAWRFTVDLSESTKWMVQLNFSGGLAGTTQLVIAVNHMHVAASPSSSRSVQPMPAMSATSDDSAWRQATFVLFGIILIGAIVVWRKPSPLSLALVVLAGLLVLGLAYLQSRYASSATSMSSMQNMGGSAPVPVTFGRVVAGTGRTTIEAPASVQPYLLQTIVTRVSGVLTDFTAYTGDKLRAGQIIARLDEPDLQSNAQAAASAAVAARNQVMSAREDVAGLQADVNATREKLHYWETELSREKTLLSAGAVSPQEYQNETSDVVAARSAYTAALAKVSGARAATRAAISQAREAAANAQSASAIAGFTNVVSPSDSVVMKRLVDPGVYVAATTPILQVAVIDRLRILAQVAQQDLAGIEIGTPMDIKFSSGRVLHSRVSSLSPVVDSTTHTAIAEAIVSNVDGIYQPGGFVSVVLRPRLNFPMLKGTMSLPSRAIVGGAHTAVWIDRSGLAHRVIVTVVSDDGSVAQVTGDLSDGLQVVVTGASGLEEGQSIIEAAP